MKKINSMLLGCLTLVCYVNGAKVDDTHSWGRLNYTTFSHFDVVFDQFDLKRTKKAISIKGGLRIPTGVTHVYLDLTGSLKFVEFPETIKYINKNIFSNCDVKTILLKNKTVESLFKNGYGENREESIRNYFSLKDTCEIVVAEALPNQEQIKNINVSSKESGKTFLDEIRVFDKKNLKSVKDEENVSQKKDNEPIKNHTLGKGLSIEDNNKLDTKNSNALFNDLRNFDSKKLRHVKDEENAAKKRDNMSLDENRSNENSLENELRKVLEKRRMDMEPDEDEDDSEEDDWGE